MAARCRQTGQSPDQLRALAEAHRSRPVHPTQLYAVVNAFIICWVLTVLFHRRKRHGIVLGWFLILYSMSRIFLELLRGGNPLDVAGLTISQAISIATFARGVL